MFQACHTRKRESGDIVLPCPNFAPCRWYEKKGSEKAVCRNGDVLGDYDAGYWKRGTRNGGRWDKGRVVSGGEGLGSAKLSLNRTSVRTALGAGKPIFRFEFV